MKHTEESQISLEKAPVLKNEKSPVLARRLSRQLNKSELSQVAGAGKGRRCWDTDGGMFTKLDCEG